MATRNLREVNTLHLDLIRQFGATGIEKDLQASLVMDQCPNFLLNKLPAELVSEIFRQAVYSFLDDWDAEAFTRTLQATPLTCCRIRHVLQQDSNLWRSIAAVASTRNLIIDDRFSSLLATCATLSHNTLDYVDFSTAFGRNDTIECKGFASCLQTLMSSSEHLKVFKGPEQFSKQLCWYPSRESISEAIFLLFNIIKKASNLSLLSIDVFEARDAISQELYGELPRAAPRSVHLTVDLERSRQPLSKQLLSFYSHLCRGSEELIIELHDHRYGGDRIMNRKQLCLPNRILEAASSTVQCLTISTNRLASHLMLPSSMPALRDLKLSTGGRDILLLGGICDVPSLNSISLPAELLLRFDAPNVTSATLLIESEWGAANIVECLSKWSQLTSLILVTRTNSRLSSETSSRVLRSILQALMDTSDGSLCCPDLEHLNIATQPWTFGSNKPQRLRLAEICYTQNNDLDIGSELLQLEEQRARLSAEKHPSEEAKVKEEANEEHSSGNNSPFRCRALSIDHIQGCRLEKARNPSKDSGPPIDWQLTSDRPMVQWTLD